VLEAVDFTKLPVIKNFDSKRIMIFDWSEKCDKKKPPFDGRPH
jgi:hypothetical protein